jgi:hypothetical protein
VRALAALILFPVALRAQIPGLNPGSRLRITTRFGAITATLVKQSPLSLEIRERPDTTRQVLLDLIDRIDTSAGPTRGAGARKGARIGGTIGGVIAGAYVVISRLATAKPDSAAIGAESGSALLGNAIVGALGGAIVGGIVGGFIGSRRKSEAWHQVYPAEPQADLEPGPWRTH